jgi:ABC-type glutathione transport system ATPase component
MNAPFPIQSGAPVLPSNLQSPPIIAFSGVSKVYPARNSSAEVVALDAIDLQVPEGAIVGVIGRSGAGKSTLGVLICVTERTGSATGSRRDPSGRAIRYRCGGTKDRVKARAKLRSVSSARAASVRAR